MFSFLLVALHLSLDFFFLRVGYVHVSKCVQVLLLECLPLRLVQGPKEQRLIIHADDSVL